MNSDIIMIDQTLHGYLEGHTLLASSFDLPSEVRRMMLLLSDMSGSRMERGFEEYVTGYPLREINKYALAKTWYAPEMRRPGCVWTHTLLIDFSDLPKVTNVTFLLSLFQRPHFNEVEKDYYSSSLNIDLVNAGTLQNILKIETPSVTPLILQHLYGGEENPVFLQSSSSYNFDLLFLMIWAQQWPRLKRSFCFCSGAISLRSLSNVLFDLQNVPLSFDKLPKSSGHAIVLSSDLYYTERIEPWLEFATYGLLNPSLDVKFFLNYFGSDVVIKRSSFGNLIRTYLFFKDEKPTLNRCIQFLATTFPSHSDANNLKSSILDTKKTSFGKLLPKYGENALLFQMATTVNFESFNYDKLNFFPRFVDFFRTINKESANLLKKIIEAGPNPHGEIAVIELAEGLREQSEMEFLWSDKQLLSVLLDLNPRLTFNHTFWTVNEGKHIEIISKLRKSNIGRDGWITLLEILLDVQSPVDINLLEGLNINLESIFFDYYNRNPSIEVGKNWQLYLNSHTTETLEWFVANPEVNEEVMSFIVKLLDPNSTQISIKGVLPWIEYLDHVAKKDYDIKIEVHAFYLALAFNMNDRNVEAIFVSSFEVVYFALATERLDFHYWRTLEVHTKSLSLWRDWDRCKKLVNALVDFYIHNKWPIKSLAMQIRNTDLRDRILSKYRRRK